MAPQADPINTVADQGIQDFLMDVVKFALKSNVTLTLRRDGQGNIVQGLPIQKDRSIIAADGSGFYVYEYPDHNPTPLPQQDPVLVQKPIKEAQINVLLDAIGDWLSDRPSSTARDALVERLQRLRQ
jgi:hypothetical protein